MILGLLLVVLLIPLPEPRVEGASRIVDQSGDVVAWLYRERREPVPLDSLPSHLRLAVLSVEDTRFYRHVGVDPVGFARSVWLNIRYRRVVAGGSTISQQLARTLYLDHAVTFERKIWEAVLALKLESRFAKDEILGLYLNQIYWGHGAYGVEMAARTYFGKSSRDLTLGESALLAGIIPSPENFSPYRNSELALSRRRIVLDRMVELGHVSPAAAAAAADQPLELVGLGTIQEERAPHFVDWILSELEAIFPGITRDVYRGGYVIETTLDLELQRAAQEIVDRRLGALGGEIDDRGVAQPQGALVTLDPQTGHVLAMVGGRDNPKDQLNRALSSRQPGSAFKPFVYTAALERGFTVDQTQLCEPITLGDYEPECHLAERFHFRDLNMREAMALSCNVTAVLWGQEVGTPRVAAAARRLGITSPIDPHDASLVLGSYEVRPLELAAAYAPLANQGIAVEVTGVLSVTDPGGRQLFEADPRARRVMEPEVAYMVTSLLRDVMTFGTGSHLRPLVPVPAAGKTGTTDGSRDAWFAGYTADVVTVVWVGYDIPRALPGFGGTLAGPIWAEVMSRASAGSPVRDFSRPEGVVSVDLCEETGLLPNPTCPTYTELFIKGTEPMLVCPEIHSDDDDSEWPSRWVPWDWLQPRGAPQGANQDP